MRTLKLLRALLVLDGFYWLFLRAPLREHLKVTDSRAVCVGSGVIYIDDREPTASNDPFLAYIRT